MLLRNSLSSGSSVSVGVSASFQNYGKNIAKPNTTIKANIPSAEMLSLVFSSMVSDGGFLLCVGAEGDVVDEGEC